MATFSFGQLMLIALAFTFVVGISRGVRRRRAQLGLKNKK